MGEGEQVRQRRHPEGDVGAHTRPLPSHQVRGSEKFRVPPRLANGVPISSQYLMSNFLNLDQSSCWETGAQGAGSMAISQCSQLRWEEQRS